MAFATALPCLNYFVLSISFIELATMKETNSLIPLFTDMVMALIDSANDKDKSVKGVVSSSLHELGCKQPALVLSSCLNYLVKHAKVGSLFCFLLCFS